MKKSLYILPFILGICCLIASSFAPSTVLASGTLYEPYFFLIPVGFIFILIGILVACIAGFITLNRKKKS